MTLRAITCSVEGHPGYSHWHYYEGVVANLAYSLNPVFQPAKHEIVWSYDNGVLSGEFKCRGDNTAICHQISDCGCETWGPLDVDDQGVFHTHDLGDGETTKHYHTARDYCNPGEFISNDDAGVTELGPETRFIVGTTRVTPEWNGVTYVWTPQ